MKLYQRLMDIRSKKEGKKGFTLVELIVVLVILAILAAILVPALLGYIDRAKESQYELEAKSIYMAAQAEASEAYAGASGAITQDDLLTLLKTTNISKIQKTSDISTAAISAVTQKGTAVTTTNQATANARDSYTIQGMTVTFTSSRDNKSVTMVLDGTKGTWTKQ